MPPTIAGANRPHIRIRYWLLLLLSISGEDVGIGEDGEIGVGSIAGTGVEDTSIYMDQEGCVVWREPKTVLWVSEKESVDKRNVRVLGRKGHGICFLVYKG